MYLSARQRQLERPSCCFASQVPVAAVLGPAWFQRRDPPPGSPSTAASFHFFLSLMIRKLGWRCTSWDSACVTGGSFTGSLIFFFPRCVMESSVASNTEYTCVSHWDDTSRACCPQELNSCPGLRSHLARPQQELGREAASRNSVCASQTNSNVRDKKKLKEA